MRILRKAALAIAILGTPGSFGPTGTGSVALAIVDGVPTGDRLANVGMLVGRFEAEGSWHWLGCSGTLIARDVFLTAAHCIALGAIPNGVVEFGVAFGASIPIDQASPRFAPIPGEVAVYPGTAIYDPRFDAAALPDPAADPFDLAVIRLLSPARGVHPARIVAANHFEAAREKYEHRRIGLAGYGITSFLPNLGLAPWDWGVRRVTTGRLDRVHSARIVVDPDPGQICGADSGGPGFVSPIHDLEGPLPPHVSVVSSTVSWTVGLGTGGGRPCETASILYRLDTPQARQFLGQFVRLSQRAS